MSDPRVEGGRRGAAVDGGRALTAAGRMWDRSVRPTSARCSPRSIIAIATASRPNHPINDPITQSPNHPIRPRLPSSGFTLIELLVVLALISILATMGLAQYRTGVTHAKEAVLKTDLFDMRDAIDQYYADKGQYPGALDALVSDGYLRKVPVDPFTNNADMWQTVPSEPDPNNPTAAPGIYDVKSGSDGTAIDGTKYSDW